MIDVEKIQKMKVVKQSPNSNIIYLDGLQILQSYGTTIAIIDQDDNVTLTKDWAASPTTSKHRNLFLNEDISETRNKIINGQYKLIN